MSIQVEFEGKCHTKAKENDYTGTYFTKEQMEDKLESLPGTPVCYEHDNEEQIGKITSARIDDTNSLAVKGYIDRRSWKGLEVVQGLRNGKLTGLSLGMNYRGEVTPEVIRVVNKTIKEVSVTDNPDSPDTTIHNVQEDSDKWKLGGEIVKQEIMNERLKTEHYKSKNRLQGLLRGLTEPNTNLIKGTLHRGGMSSNTTTPPLDTSTPETTDKPESGNDANNEEMDALKQELALSQGKAKQLEEEKSQYAGLYNEIASDPDKWQKILLDKKLEEEEDAKRMQESGKLLSDFFTASFIDQGKKPPQALLNVAQHGYKKPADYKHLFDFATVAHANKVQSQSEAEKKIQAMQKRHADEIKVRDVELKKRNTDFQNIQDQWKRDEQAKSYQQNMDNRGHKKPQVKFTEQQPKQKKPEEKQDTSFTQQWDSQPPVMDPRIKGIRPGGGLQHSEDESHTEFLRNLMGGNESVVIPTGMGIMNVPGMVGKYFHKAKSGVDLEYPNYPAMDSTFTVASGAPPDPLKD